MWKDCGVNNQETYRPRANLIFAGFGAVLSGLFTWSSFYQSSSTTELTSVLVALFVLICIYIFLIRPKITFSDEGVVITNPLEEITVGWADVIQLDTRWALSIETKEFTVSSWAATASGRHKGQTIHHTEIKGLDIQLGESIRKSDSPHSDSGAAAYRARVRLKRFQDSGSYQSLPTARVRHLKPLIFAIATLITAIAVNTFSH